MHVRKRFTSLRLGAFLIGGGMLILAGCRGSGNITPPSAAAVAPSGGQASIPYVPTTVTHYVPNPNLTILSIHKIIH
jgi:hypothetical protein